MESASPKNLPTLLDLNRTKKILIIDDDQSAIDIMSMALSWEGYQIESCLSGAEAKTHLKNNRFDLILLDINLPDISGFELLYLTKKEVSAFTSVIFVSGESTTESVVKGLDQGADDYIIKPFTPAEFLARIRAQLRIKDLTDRLTEANIKLQELVEIDDLTGLFNMRSIYQKLELEIERARRYNREVCVVMLDMDHFKSVNDGHDHLFGSFVLSEVGKIISKVVRNIDIAARYGGDEFLIILTETNESGAYSFCQRLRMTIESYLFKNGPDEIKLTASIGFAITEPAHFLIDGHNLVRAADRSLYKAKHDGRNQVKGQKLVTETESSNPQ